MALTQIEPYALDSANSFTVTNLTATGNVTVTGNIIASGNVIATGNVTTSGSLNGSIGTLNNVTLSGYTTQGQTSEIISTTLTGATGTVVHDTTTGSTFYHTGIVANFTPNFTNVPTTNSRSITVVLVLIQGSTAYLPNAVQINGVSQTIKWANASAPTPTASRVEVVSFSLIYISGAWTVIGQLSTYG